AGGTTGTDYATVAYDASTGARLWVKRYDGRAYNDDYAYGLAVSPDGATMFVTGRSRRLATYYDYATGAYDTGTGAKLWTKRYNGAANDEDQANDVAVSPDSSTVFVTGYSLGSGTGYDYATVAYAAS